MKVMHMEQRSDEWRRARAGVFTASDFGPFITGTDKKSETARQNFIDTKLGELADGDGAIIRPDGSILIPRDFQNYDMERGTLLEPRASAAFTDHTGHELESVGFVLHDNGMIGCSPDVMFSNSSGIGLEMKCPSGKIQVKRIREKITPPEYLYQIHGSMVITGADEWHFWSWHPTLPPVHTIERRNALTVELEAGLLALCAEFARQGAELRAQIERSAA